MPDMKEGSFAIDVSQIIRHPGTGINYYTRFIKLCESCVIVEKPSIITIGGGLDVVLGVGSLVCRTCPDDLTEEATREGIRVHKLKLPAWIDGKSVTKNNRCYTNSLEDARFLENLGVEVLETDNSILEMLLEPSGIQGRYFIVLDKVQGLYVDYFNRICGRLRTLNPLHPAGVFGKLGVHVCLEGGAFLSEKLARFAEKILLVDEKPIILKIELLRGTVFLPSVGFEKVSSVPVRAAVMLGAIYECL